MNVSIRDIEVLRYLEPDVIQQYLQVRQWQEHQAVHNASLWTRNGNSSSPEVLLPSDQTLTDFPRRMYELLETLEGVEGRCLRHSKAPATRYLARPFDISAKYVDSGNRD